MDLASLLELERREWGDRIREERSKLDDLLEVIKRRSINTANPNASYEHWARPERLASTKRHVEARLAIREEFGRHEPELLSPECLATLREELVDFAWKTHQGDSSSKAGAGDIIACVKTAIDKLPLKAKWAKVSKPKSVNVTLHGSPGAIVNIDSIVGDISSNTKMLTESGRKEIADALTALAEAIQNGSVAEESRRELLQNIDLLSAQATLPPEKRTTGIIKTICLGLPTLVTISGKLAEAWQIHGPAIREFFKIGGSQS